MPAIKVAYWSSNLEDSVAKETRKLCYRKDVRAMHNPTIRKWFEARKSICTDCWAVRAKIRQNGRFGGRRGETGSRNMATIQKIERALVTSYRPSIVTFPLS